MQLIHPSIHDATHYSASTSVVPSGAFGNIGIHPISQLKVYVMLASVADLVIMDVLVNMKNKQLCQKAEVQINKGTIQKRRYG